jgi:hypothetical protein
MIVAPKRRAGGGRYSETDLITYERVESLCEIDFVSKTHLSAKSVLFPVREAMFSLERDTCEEVRINMGPPARRRRRLRDQGRTG